MDERDDARRMADDLDSSRSRVTGHEVKHETPWLTFKHLTYEDPAGKTRKWDMVGRSTRAPNAVADAVCVFAVLRKSGEPNTTLLVRQFRPPLDAETIELPRGWWTATSHRNKPPSENSKRRPGTSASSPRTPRTRVW